MRPTVETSQAEIAAAALALPAEARTRLAAQLLDSLWCATEPGVSERHPYVPILERIRFWEGPRNAELDRLGDWLLANHTAIREESIDRGESL